MRKKVMVESANVNGLWWYIHLCTNNFVHNMRTVEYEDDYAVVITLANDCDYDKIVDWVLSHSES